MTVLRVAVDVRHRVVADQGDQRVGPQLRVAEGQVVGVATGEVAGEGDAVVRAARLLGQDGDAPGAGGVAVAQRLDQPLGDHAAADDDEVLVHGVLRRAGGWGTSHGRNRLFPPMASLGYLGGTFPAHGVGAWCESEGMSPVIALLRAVNVGGRTVKSAQLRAVAESLGHTQVTTYVNSGNIVLVPSGAASAVGPGTGRGARRGARLRRPRDHPFPGPVGRHREAAPVPRRGVLGPVAPGPVLLGRRPRRAPTSTRRRTAARPSRSPATRPTRTSRTASAAPSSPSPCWRRRPAGPGPPATGTRCSRCSGSPASAPD